MDINITIVLLENWHQKNNDIDGAIASANYLGSKDLSNTLINSSDYYNELENLSAAIDSLKQAINAASKIENSDARVRQYLKISQELIWICYKKPKLSNIV